MASSQPSTSSCNPQLNPELETSNVEVTLNDESSQRRKQNTRDLDKGGKENVAPVPGVHEPRIEPQHINTGLEEYIKSTSEGKAIIKQYEKFSAQRKPLPKNIRCRLARLVIKREKDLALRKISADQILEKFVITTERFTTLASEIDRIFKYESAEVYYSPYKKSGKTVINTSGTLWTHFCYKKDTMKADDILAQKEIIDEDQIIISNSEEERIDWLSENIDPWTKVEQYWQETSVARRQLFLKNTEFTVHAYFEKFKCLSTQKGKELLELDFSLLYTNVTPIDYSEWKRIRDLLMNQFDMHKIKNAEELGLINSLKSGDLSNEKQDFLLMYLLVHLLPPKSRGRKRKATSENQEIVNQASSKKSLEERRESFILHVESDAEVEPKILELKKRLQIAKETFQPLIIAVGRNLTSIESYHIAVNDQLYELSNCLETVVVALKIFFSLDCEYPENTQVIWKFLQQVLLNIKEEKVVTVQMKTYFGLIKIVQDNI